MVAAWAAPEALKLLVLDNGPTLPNLDIIGEMTSLQRLDLRNTPIGIGPTSLTPLTRLKHLRSIFLLGRLRSYKNLTDLDRLGEIASMESLTLDNIADLHAIA